MEEFWVETPENVKFRPDGRLAYQIKRRVYCRIVEAVVRNRNEGRLPKGWAVQVTLSLQVDETGAFNPGISFINPIGSGQSFTLGLGGILSSQGTREDKSGNYWNLDKFTGLALRDCGDEGHNTGNSKLLETELGINDWLTDALRAQKLLPSSALPADTDSVFKQVALTYHVKFIVITTGTAAPTWKLVRVASGNGNLPLVSMNRTRTHDLVLTFGPACKAGKEHCISIDQHNATIINTVNPIINP
jgi:hypothetical protein